MIGFGVFTVFALGLRHGAEPDHLAAIDNLTRNSVERQPLFSRFVGTLFAGGHSVMVLALASLVGYLGTKIAVQHALIETIGTWISIVVLVAIAVANLRQLRDGAERIAGVKTRLLPAKLRDGTNPLLAIPIGLLFGFGFETSSQVATYALAFGVNAGVFGALAVGAAFCLGMICTDTLDSVLVHRLVTARAQTVGATVRVWIWSVTLVALVVAAYELAQVLGWHSPVPDIVVSAAIVTALVAVFIYVFAATRHEPAATVIPAISGGEQQP